MGNWKMITKTSNNSSATSFKTVVYISFSPWELSAFKFINLSSSIFFNNTSLFSLTHPCWTLDSRFSPCEFFHVDIHKQIDSFCQFFIPSYKCFCLSVRSPHLPWWFPFHFCIPINALALCFHFYCQSVLIFSLSFLHRFPGSPQLSSTIPFILRLFLTRLWTFFFWFIAFFNLFCQPWMNYFSW